ncbi:MAG TPA: TraR/DksA C4-type zinc finger protein [Acidimicrobiales bacterium]|jgi:RNA polymerase-binding transcription factor DksA|nr:TraR/DksA C4-type zinc finger protein [Acidimicrobiales bacterium]
MEPGVDLSILDQLEEDLRQVEAALHRLERGAYGVCEVCAAPISDARLDADPLTRLCRDHDRLG